MYNTDDLRRALSSYCNWQALSKDLLISAINNWVNYHGGNKPSATAADSELLEAFQSQLVKMVPMEWTLVQHDAFPADSNLLPAMHSRAVGTPHGSMTFGGMEVGKLNQVHLKSEVSWLREHQPYMLQPDCSRVYKASLSKPSKQVLAITADEHHNGAWSAEPVSPCLPYGLLGHSVAQYGSRAFIFGGLCIGATAVVERPGTGNNPTSETCNRLLAYAINAEGTQQGKLPVLSNLPQMGAVPSSRMYHRAAVDSDAGIMYVYGGVHIRNRDKARLPADSEAGTVHCFKIHSYKWTTMTTTGGCRPCSTTLLAFGWHKGALWAVPDLPVDDRSSRNSSRASSKKGQQGYKLLRLDLYTKAWQEVTTVGKPPCQRSDACSIHHNSQIIVYGGKTVQAPCSLLSDLHVLDLDQQPPAWKQVQPRLVGNGSNSSTKCGSTAAGNSRSGSSSNGSQQQSPLLPLAGHAGAVSGDGCVVFCGGYRRNDLKEPQPLLQVLQQGVKPPTPDAATVTGHAAAPLLLALQHVRLQLARLVRQQHPTQVLLKPDNGGGVRLPAKLLALHSCLFDDMFQDMLNGEDDVEETHTQQAGALVPVPGVSQDGLAAVGRWMMGLLALGSCSIDTLIGMYRVADRLIMEQLMVEVLRLLHAMDLSHQQVATVLQLAGDTPTERHGPAVLLSTRGAPALRCSAVTAPVIMALACKHHHTRLQAQCINVMTAHRKNDVWAVLDFACYFGLNELQRSCLAQLSHASRGRLVDHVDRVVRVAGAHADPGTLLQHQPGIGFLETELLQELPTAEATSLVVYAAVAEKLQLQQLSKRFIDHCSKPEGWQQLHSNQQVLQQLQQELPDMFNTIRTQAAAHAAAASQE